MGYLLYCITLFTGKQTIINVIYVWGGQTHIPHDYLYDAEDGISYTTLFTGEQDRMICIICDGEVWHPTP